MAVLLKDLLFMQEDQIQVVTENKKYYMSSESLTKEQSELLEQPVLKMEMKGEDAIFHVREPQRTKRQLTVAELERICDRIIYHYNGELYVMKTPTDKQLQYAQDFHWQETVTKLPIELQKHTVVKVIPEVDSGGYAAYLKE